ncbi:MAG: HIT family protein [Bacilli bacterium]
MNECLFCKIIKGDIPSYTIFEDEFVKVFLDINPSTNGDCLVVPKKHFTNITDIDLETLNHINEVAKNLYPTLKEKLSCDGLTLVQNNDFGQEVKHYHLHLTPRYKNDMLTHNFNKDILLKIEEIYEKLK